MSHKKQGRFAGFYPETLSFLKNIAANNDKGWFEAHRQEYQDFLMQPLRNLVMDLGDFMLSIDPYLEVTPAVNKAISRIYRDTRFSRDKSLFRSNMWITFKRPGKDWKDAPGFFFEIFANWYRYGMGFYSASPSTMSRFREKIEENPDEFIKVISFYSKQKIFVLEGEKYKKIFNRSLSQEIQNWYQRKNFYLVCNRTINNRLFSRDLVDDLKSGFRLLAPFYHYLWNIKSSKADKAATYFF